MSEEGKQTKKGRKHERIQKKPFKECVRNNKKQ